MVPTWALPSMAQAVAVRIGGMKNGSVISASSTPRPGVSVRAMIQASSTASASDRIVLTREMPTVLASTTRFSAEARPIYPSRLNSPGIPGGVE